MKACLPIQEAQDPGLQLPAYYRTSFHAYQQGTCAGRQLGRYSSPGQILNESDGLAL